MSLKVSAAIAPEHKHGNDVTALWYQDDVLYSGGDGGFIKSFTGDLKTKIADVRAHTGSVFSLTACPLRLYSCSNDGTVKSWTLRDLMPAGQILKEGQSEIWRVAYENGVLYAGDNEGFVWTFRGEKPEGHFNVAEPVKDMAVKNHILYTVRDKDVVVTEIIPGTTSEFGTRGDIMGRAPICLVDDKMAFASRSGKDILIHENHFHQHYKQVCEQKDAHELIINAITAVKRDNDILIYSGGWDKVVKQWKLADGKLELVASCPVNFVINALVLGNQGQVYVAGGDGKIVRID